MADENEINQNTAQDPIAGKDSSTTTLAPQSAASSDYNAHELRIAKLEQAAKETQTKLIESLGIFTALFTFVSISIQIFHNVQYLDVAVILVVFLFIALGGFVYLLDTVLNKNKNSFVALLIISGILVAVAFLLASSQSRLRLFGEIPNYTNQG